jgi:hypothetical protein
VRKFLTGCRLRALRSSQVPIPAGAENAKDESVAKKIRDKAESLEIESTGCKTTEGEENKKVSNQNNVKPKESRNNSSGG